MVSVSAERNAQQLKLKHPKIFTDICHSYAGRLLGITDRCHVGDLLGDSVCPDMSVASSSKKLPKGQKLSHQILGSSLDVGIVESIVPVIKFLHSSDCLNTEGLFRKSGNCSRLKILRDSLNRGEDIGRVLAVGSFNAHDCASILKAFLAELPEPLLSERHFRVYRLAAGLPAEQHLQLLQILIHLLPPANILLLKHLFGLLRRVSEQKETRMTASSLGILFAPHLLIPRVMAASEVASVLPGGGQVVAVMISRSTVLFRLPDNVLCEMEHRFAMLDGGTASGHCPRRVERRCAMKRARAKTDPGMLKSAVQVPVASGPSIAQPSADRRLTHGDKFKVVKESSRLIIVDLLPNSSTNSDTNTAAECSEPMTTYCCPRTGHYSKSDHRHQSRVRTRASCKYASVTSA